MSSLEIVGKRSQAYPLITRLLLWAGTIGPLFFVVVLLIEGATRPGYNAWRNFGSSLSLGSQGWMQIANFLICGVLMIGFAFGLRQALHLKWRQLRKIHNPRFENFGPPIQQ